MVKILLIDQPVVTANDNTLMPGVIRNLYQLQQLHGYQLVLLAANDLPDWVRYTFTTEGLAITILDNTTDLYKAAIEGRWDMENSRFVAANATNTLNLPALVLGSPDVTDWDAVLQLLQPKRMGRLHRKTNETDILVEVNLDGSGKSDTHTGIGFFDHMLDQLARHGGCDLTIAVKGDLHIDEHHTVEDTALALGEAFLKALGDKRGIERYGFALPMDDCLAQVAIDFGGRPWLVWNVHFTREKIGEMPTELFQHFFKSFSDTAKCNLNIQADGENEHHKIEAIFKAFAKAIKMAKRKDEDNNQLPSTKGTL
jgi:imidazoleglycerol-phosphate dehydratase/histidinol-phosphatase